MYVLEHSGFLWYIKRNADLQHRSKITISVVITERKRTESSTWCKWMKIEWSQQTLVPWSCQNHERKRFSPMKRKFHPWITSGLTSMAQSREEIDWSRTDCLYTCTCYLEKWDSHITWLFHHSLPSVWKGKMQEMSVPVLKKTFSQVPVLKKLKKVDPFQWRPQSR